MKINIRKFIESFESDREVNQSEIRLITLGDFKNARDTACFGLKEISNQIEKKAESLSSGESPRDIILKQILISPNLPNLIKVYQLASYYSYRTGFSGSYILGCEILKGSELGNGYTLNYIGRTDVKELANLLKDYDNGLESRVLKTLENEGETIKW